MNPVSLQRHDAELQQRWLGALWGAVSICRNVASGSGEDDVVDETQFLALFACSNWYADSVVLGS